MGKYPGEVLFNFEGRTMVLEIFPEELENVKFGLFWQTEDLEDFQMVNTVEVGGEIQGEFPAGYNIALHHPPPPEAMLNVDYGDGKVAMALLLLYQDKDKDNVFNEDLGDTRLGGSFELILLYADSELSPDEWSPLTDSIPAGYSFASIGNNSCNNNPPECDNPPCGEFPSECYESEDCQPPIGCFMPSGCPQPPDCPDTAECPPEPGCPPPSDCPPADVPDPEDIQDDSDTDFEYVNLEPVKEPRPVDLLITDNLDGVLPEVRCQRQ